MSSSRAPVLLIVSLGILFGALVPNTVVQGAPMVDEAEVTSLKEGYQTLAEQVAAIFEDIRTFAASPEAEYVKGLAADVAYNLATAIRGSGLTQVTTADLKAAVSKYARIAVQRILSFLESDDGKNLVAEVRDTEPFKNLIAAVEDGRAIAGSLKTAVSTPEGAAFRGRILAFAKELRCFLGNLLDVTSEIAAAEARDLLVEYADMTPDEVSNLRDTMLARARSFLGSIRKFLESVVDAD